jgi:hypothetical protein
MPLSKSSRHRWVFEESVEAAGEVALKAAVCFASCLCLLRGGVRCRRSLLGVGPGKETRDHSTRPQRGPLGTLRSATRRGQGAPSARQRCPQRRPPSTRKPTKQAISRGHRQPPPLGTVTRSAGFFLTPGLVGLPRIAPPGSRPCASWRARARPCLCSSDA